MPPSAPVHFAELCEMLAAEAPAALVGVRAASAMRTAKAAAVARAPDDGGGAADGSGGGAGGGSGGGGGGSGGAGGGGAGGGAGAGEPKSEGAAASAAGSHLQSCVGLAVPFLLFSPPSPARRASGGAGSWSCRCLVPQRPILQRRGSRGRGWLRRRARARRPREAGLHVTHAREARAVRGARSRHTHAERMVGGGGGGNLRAVLVDTSCSPPWLSAISWTRKTRPSRAAGTSGESATTSTRSASSERCGARCGRLPAGTRGVGEPLQ